LYLQHLLLLSLWIAYCLLHSVLASSKFKLGIEKISAGFSRYYRLVYSIFAAVSLAGLLFFQCSMQSPLLVNSFFLKLAGLVILVLPGATIMMISIFKYFKLLSGVRSLYEPRPPVGLKLDGVHKFVRHPLYSGTLLFVWGLFLIFPFLNNLIAVAAITGYVVIGIKFEEKKLLNEFGNVYAEYIRNVPALLPALNYISSKKKGQPFGHP
jgi:protein-S-isoprenylcysteine O-methyltransferase Ste14